MVGARCMQQKFLQQGCFLLGRAEWLTLAACRRVPSHTHTWKLFEKSTSVLSVKLRIWRQNLAETQQECSQVGGS